MDGYIGTCCMWHSKQEQEVLLPADGLLLVVGARTRLLVVGWPIVAQGTPELSRAVLSSDGLIPAAQALPGRSVRSCLFGEARMPRSRLPLFVSAPAAVPVAAPLHATFHHSYLIVVLF